MLTQNMPARFAEAVRRCLSLHRDSPRQGGDPGLHTTLVQEACQVMKRAFGPFCDYLWYFQTIQLYRTLDSRC